MSVTAAPAGDAWPARASTPSARSDAGVLRVFVIDDQRLVRAGLQREIEADGTMRVVGECHEPPPPAVLDAAAPDVVLMDVSGGPTVAKVPVTSMNGDPACPIVALSAAGSYEALGWALSAGARGFVLKEAPGDDIVRAVRAVAGGAWLDPSITTQVLATYRDVMSRTEERQLPNLTTRELDVLRLVGRGATNSEIARQLFIGQATVKSHVSNILTKLDLRDRIAAVVFAFDYGIVHPSHRLSALYSDAASTPLRRDFRKQPGEKPMGSVAFTLKDLADASGTYWGTGDGIESSTFVGRVVVAPAISAVRLDYEAWSDREGLQHREQALVVEGPAGLELHTTTSEMPGLLTFVADEAGQGFVLSGDAPMAMRIVLELPEPGTLRWAWWWSPPGEEIVERSALLASRVY